MCNRGLVLVALPALIAACSASTAQNPVEEGRTMTAIEIANAYYGEFRPGGDFSRVPMAPRLRFVSPAMQLDSAAAFRSALATLSPRIRSLEIRHQLADGDTVLSVYDLDLGTPGGPIPMAERLTVVDRAITSVELLFDSARLPPPPRARE